jgi:hypothetical protein
MIYLQLKHTTRVRNFFFFGNNLSFETFPLFPMLFYTALLGGIYCLQIFRDAFFAKALKINFFCVQQKIRGHCR